MTLTVDDRELIERALALSEECRIGVEDRGVMPTYVDACVTLKSLAPKLLATCQSLLSDRDKLELRVRELEVALRPFAWHVGKSDEMVKLVIGKDCWTRTLFTDDFERARAALRSTDNG